MLSKIFTGFVVTFWLVMMTALVRVEFYPRESRLVTVSTERVLDKIFKNPEPVRLEVIYQRSKIGFFRMDITGLKTSEEQQPPTKAEAYDVTTDLSLNLIVFGASSRLHVGGKLLFDPKYEMKTFQLNTRMAGNRVDIEGDNTSRQLIVSYDVGDGQQRRQLDYDDLNGPDMFKKLGLTGLQDLPGLGSLALLGGASPATVAKTVGPHLVTRTYYDFIATGSDLKQRAYLMEMKMEQNPGLWAKIWVDEQGNILIIDTSAGLSLRSTKIGNTDDRQIVDRTFERGTPRP